MEEIQIAKSQIREEIAQKFAALSTKEIAEKTKAIEADENYLPAYSGYASLLVARNQTDAAIAQYQKLLEKKPEELIRHAVKGMLPKNKLGRKLFKKLKVYTGNTHPHEAQQPEVLAN